MSDGIVLNISYEEKIRDFLMTVSGFDPVSIIRWMHTPNPDWKGYSPNTMISVGKGEIVLDYLKEKERCVEEG